MDGGTTEAEIDAALEDVAALANAGELDAARRLVLRTVERARPLDSPVFARSLHTLASVQLASGLAKEAARTAREFMSWMDGRAEDSVAAESAFQFANGLERDADYEEAEEFYALAERLFARGGDPGRAATARNNLGLARHRRGDFSGAAQALDAAALAYASLGSEYDENVVLALQSLAKVYEAAGDEDAARETWQRFATALQKLIESSLRAGDFETALRSSQSRITLATRLYGPGHPNVAASRSDRAFVLRRMGSEAAAEREMRAVLDQLKISLGMGSRPTRSAASNLALLLRDLGRYGEASTLLDEAVTGLDGAADRTDAEHETLLTNLAEIRSSTGDLAGAVELHERALDLARRAYGARSAELRKNIINLALTLGKAGRREEMWARFAEARDTEGLDPKDPFFLAAWQSAVQLLLDGGHYEQAQTQSAHAQTMMSMALGDRHPMLASASKLLALVALRRGKPEHARNAARQGLRILDASRPGANTVRADLQGYLGEALALLRDHARALEAAAESQRTYDVLVGQVFTTASDRQRTEFVAEARRDFDSFLSVFVAGGLDSSRARVALSGVLRRKGLSVEAYAVQREAVVASHHPELRNKLIELRVRRREAAVAALGEMSTSDEVRKTKELEALEVELARRIPEMDIERRLRLVDVEAVARALPNASTLVEIVRTTISSLAQPTKDGIPPQTPRYLAFVLASGKPDSVSCVDLGSADEIDTLVTRARAATTSEGNRAFVSANPAPVEPTDGARRALRRLVWDPLANHIQGAKHVIVAPDGALSFVAFDTLLDDRDRVPLDDVSISYVSSGREVLRFTEPRAPAGPAWVVGDPDYSLNAPSGEERATARPFAPLLGARHEAEEVAARLGVAACVGADVLKARWFEQESPRVLHIATHGFAAPEFSESLQKLTNPMLRAGLALSGINTYVGGHPLPEDAGNGILTASEIAELDLHGTELVVLSACQTGSGTEAAQEGVYGLRRALALAGARTQIVSLWDVSDRATLRLMTAFYDALADGLSCADALSQAKHEVRRTFPSHLAWGAFICLGDPAPLSVGSVPTKGAFA